MDFWHDIGLFNASLGFYDSTICFVLRSFPFGTPRKASQHWAWVVMQIFQLKWNGAWQAFIYHFKKFRFGKHWFFFQWVDSTQLRTSAAFHWNNLKHDRKFSFYYQSNIISLLCIFEIDFSQHSHSFIVHLKR